MRLPEGKKGHYVHTTVSRVVAYTAAKDKALVEIYVNRAALAKEWYHVVLKRVGQDWIFFSITVAAIS